MDLKASFYILLSLGLALSGCGGDDGGSVRGRELNQDVRLVEYDLKVQTVDVEVVYASGKVKRLHEDTTSPSGDARDKMQRIIDSGRFTLVVNDKNASVDIGPDGRIESRSNPSAQTGDCRFNGLSIVTGESTHAHLLLDITIQSVLEGRDCTATSRDHAVDFQDGELAKFNLQSIQALLDADQTRDQATRVLLRVHVEGENRPSGP